MPMRPINRRLIAALFAMTAAHFLSARSAEASLDALIPVPHSVAPKGEALRLSRETRFVLEAPEASRAESAANRFLRRLDGRTGLFLPIGFERIGSGATIPSGAVSVRVQRTARLEVGASESYRIEIDGAGARLEAETDLGALRGLETLLQLLAADDAGFMLPGVAIEDAPRFPWRGLMIDSARHFMPLDVIKRNLDGMAAVKLNVLHWHLTEDQGFRIESKRYPRLHELGSDGLYYTQEQVKEIIAYADARGIRVYPEFDVPGHATSWLVGHPELASAPGPYEIERRWGIFDPALDPTNEAVYELLDGFFTEMAELFPDPFFHIGGDEVNGNQWNANERIQAFMAEKGIEDLHALQGHFNQRILKTLARNGKTMVGWDEILVPGMPTEIVIHSWRGRDSMEKAAKEGYRSILSNGYYIDLMQPASDHYLNDPLPADLELSEAERARVLGGEATMWSEHVTPETVDSRIWPRTAAIAERLWSDPSVRDVPDMYRRLDLIAIQLEELGLTHIKNRAMMMRRLVSGYDVEPLRVLADVVEPLKIYRRNSDDSLRSYSPYTLLADIAVADAKDARIFAQRVDRYLSDRDPTAKADLEAMLRVWAENHPKFAALAAAAPTLRENLELSEALRDLAQVGLAAVEGEPLPANHAAILERARLPVAKVELQIVDSIAKLIDGSEGL